MSTAVLEFLEYLFSLAHSAGCFTYGIRDAVPTMPMFVMAHSCFKQQAIARLACSHLSLYILHPRESHRLFEQFG